MRSVSMTKETISINANGFVEFKNRNWNFSGDKSTWVRKNSDDSYTLQRASKGIMTEEFITELSEFCTLFGVDFHDVKSGDRIVLEY
jgi:hypothetical protein